MEWGMDETNWKWKAEHRFDIGCQLYVERKTNEKNWREPNASQTKQNSFE